MSASTFIEIDDSPFIRSHMRSPRGRGSWAFTIGQPDYRDVQKDVIFTPGGMSWSEAKVWIKAWFRDQQIAGRFPSAADLRHVTLYAQP